MSKRKHAIEAHFQHGVRLHQSGRLAEAEQVYCHLLAATPSHAETLHMLGVLALQCGQPGVALVNIDQAIALRPATAMYHVNRANALLALGEKEAARPVWVALQHGPDWRWQREREDCAWYPSMRLFRQTRRGDWDDVFTRITAAVAELVPA